MNKQINAIPIKCCSFTRFCSFLCFSECVSDMIKNKLSFIMVINYDVLLRSNHVLIGILLSFFIADEKNFGWKGSGLSKHW